MLGSLKGGKVNIMVEFMPSSSQQNDTSECKSYYFITKVLSLYTRGFIRVKNLTIVDYIKHRVNCTNTSLSIVKYINSEREATQQKFFQLQERSLGFDPMHWIHVKARSYKGNPHCPSTKA